MGWIAGSYGITTNIGLITSVVDNVTIEILNNKLTAKSIISLPSGSDYNTAAGTDALTSFTTGYSNTAVGYQALYALTEGYSNIAVGGGAANGITTGYYNIAIGTDALAANYPTSYQNMAIGIGALEELSTAGSYSNIAIGTLTAYQMVNGSNNVFIGQNAVESCTGGSGAGTTNNVIIGYEAGYSFTTASGNVFIGYQAGYSETGSNLLYISNSNTSTPLIYGNFSSATLKINGTLTPNGLRENIAAKTAAYTLTATDSYITASASSAAFTITLP